MTHGNGEEILFILALQKRRSHSLAEFVSITSPIGQKSLNTNSMNNFSSIKLSVVSSFVLISMKYYLCPYSFLITSSPSLQRFRSHFCLFSQALIHFPTFCWTSSSLYSSSYSNGGLSKLFHSISHNLKSIFHQTFLLRRALLEQPLTQRRN